MSERLRQWADWLVAANLSPWLFLLLLALVFSEAAFFIGFVLPGETALLLGGVLSATGVFPLAAFLPAAWVAAIAGDSTGYALGHRYGGRIRASRPGQFVGEHRWQLAEAFIRDHGGKAIFLGRGQAFLRALVPSLAGVVRMRYALFLRWNVLGAVVWGSAVVLLGFVFANSLQRLERVLGLLGLVTAGTIVAVLLVWRHRRPRGADGQEHLDATSGRDSDAGEHA